MSFEATEHEIMNSSSIETWSSVTRGPSPRSGATTNNPVVARAPFSKTLLLPCASTTAGCCWRLCLSGILHEVAGSSGSWIHFEYCSHSEFFRPEVVLHCRQVAVGSRGRLACPVNESKHIRAVKMSKFDTSKEFAHYYLNFAFQVFNCRRRVHVERNHQPSQSFDDDPNHSNGNYWNVWCRWRRAAH
jgi:hypothetical protein